jgi:hypothetical protein
MRPHKNRHQLPLYPNILRKIRILVECSRHSIRNEGSLNKSGIKLNDGVACSELQLEILGFSNLRLQLFNRSGYSPNGAVLPETGLMPISSRFVRG